MTALLAPPLYPTLADLFAAARGTGCPECPASIAADCDDSAGLRWARFKAARHEDLIGRDDFARLMTVAPQSFSSWAVVPWPVTA